MSSVIDPSLCRLTRPQDAEIREGSALKFPELTYASPGDAWLKQRVISVVETLSGRNRLIPYYEAWRNGSVGRSTRVMGDMLDLLGMELRVSGAAWPQPVADNEPLVIVANHPYGIADGVAALALAEKLGRPYKVLINKDLCKVPEIRPYALSINFEETREALQENLATRREALQLLKGGVTIVVFPAGGVATAHNPFGKAAELPWKTFTARMIREARASVLPVFFSGQNGFWFHLVSRISVTLRLSLLIREFRRRMGAHIDVRVGDVVDFSQLEEFRDRKALTAELYRMVHALDEAD